MEDFGYLFAAYSIIWLVVFAYVLILVRREKAIRREIASLKETLKYPE